MGVLALYDSPYIFCAVLFVASTVLLVLFAGVGFGIGVIPAAYVGVPFEEGTLLRTTFGVKDWGGFLLIFAALFISNCASSYIETQYSLWRWKVQFGILPTAGTKGNAASTLLITFFNEFFMTLVNAVSLALSFGHIYYLMNVVVARFLVGSLINLSQGGEEFIFFWKVA